jgi:hypothetical protein
MATVADSRKLTDEENAAAIAGLSDPDFRVQARSAAAIERGGSPAAYDALVLWEEEVNRHELGRETPEDIEDDAP